MEKTNFKDWYKKKFDPSGCVYPSAPLDIGFTEMCDRVDEYLMDYANQKQPISAERKQELFNYFYDNHDFMLLEDDYEKIKAIYGGFKQPTPTDEEIVKEARKFEDYQHEDSEFKKHESTGRYHGFVKGAKWLRDTYQPTEQLPFEEMDEKRYQLIYSAIPSMVDIIHISDHTREEIANCVNAVLGNYQPTEQQSWLLEELQSIRNYMQEKDAYHGYGQMDDLIKKLETPSK